MLHLQKNCTDKVVLPPPATPLGSPAQDDKAALALYSQTVLSWVNVWREGQLLYREDHPGTSILCDPPPLVLPNVNEDDAIKITGLMATMLQFTSLDWIECGKNKKAMNTLLFRSIMSAGARHTRRLKLLQNHEVFELYGTFQAHFQDYGMKMWDGYEFEEVIPLRIEEDVEIEVSESDEEEPRELKVLRIKDTIISNRLMEDVNQEKRLKTFLGKLRSFERVLESPGFGSFPLFEDEDEREEVQEEGEKPKQWSLAPGVGKAYQKLKEVRQFFENDAHSDDE
jgi:hypothetical protein